MGLSAILVVMTPAAYFDLDENGWFQPTDYARGPWDVGACHAGPPTALMARASESLVDDKPLVRLLVEISRPIPMSGFSIDAQVVRSGRTVATTRVELGDGDRSFATAQGLHLATADVSPVETHPVWFPALAESVPGAFPIAVTHGEVAFDESLEVRYGPEGSRGNGGETFMWAKARIPIIAGEQPSPFQILCPLADSGNGISWHEGTATMAFLNADLVLSVHRPPVGEWVGSHTVSFWEGNGIGRADALLFDGSGAVGRATQNLVLRRRD